eukprot:1842056-Prymnesium_polylepis.1
MLQRYGLREGAAAEICDIAQYLPFKANDVLVQPLTACTELLLVVEGHVLVENMRMEVREGALHAVEYFAGAEGQVLTSVGRAVATSVGLLARLNMHRLE